MLRWPVAAIVRNVAASAAVARHLSAATAAEFTLVLFPGNLPNIAKPNLIVGVALCRVRLN